MLYEVPYYAVIFTSQKRTPAEGYDSMSTRMEELASQQDGYLGVQSARGEDGVGITVSYWKNLESVAKWKAQMEHREAQKNGKSSWYSSYEVRICKVEREYGFGNLDK